MDYKHSFIKVNHIRLHYVTAGNGPLIIFLHGFPECWYSWRHQIAEFAKTFCVVAPDLRGYNLSDKPQGTNAYEISILVKDIVELIKALGRTKAVIAGHDWGGGIAWLLAMHYPEYVEKLVVMNCPHPAIYMQVARAQPWKLIKSWYVLFFQIPWLPEFLLKINHAWAVGKIIRATAVQKNVFAAKDLTYLREAAMQKKALKSAINYYRAFLRYLPKSDWLNIKFTDWPKISVPTLLLWGEQDKFLDNILSENLAPLFSSSLQIEKISDCGHWVQQEKKNLVNDYLNEFFCKNNFNF